MAKLVQLGVNQAVSYGDGKLAITTFGRGASKKIAFLGDWDTPYEAGKFSVDSVGRTIKVSSGLFEERLEASIVNPAERLRDSTREDFGKDYLLLKESLEEEIFGKSFPKDNIRIQIAHCILDIQKILGLYVNDIVYAINNLHDQSGVDIVGISHSDERKALKALASMQDFLGFFGLGFKSAPKKGRGKNAQEEFDRAKKETDKHNVGVLRTLSAARHFTAHFTNSRVFFGSGDSIKKNFTEKLAAWDIVEENYKRRIDAINDSFLEHSKMNLHILINEIYRTASVAEKLDICEQYYNFSIKKDCKNLGVKLTKIRELAIDQFYPELKDDKHNSYRSKIYAITDFVFFRYLNDQIKLAEMVETLQNIDPQDPKSEKRFEGLRKKFCANPKLHEAFDEIVSILDAEQRKKRGQELADAELYAMVAKLRTVSNDDEAKEGYYREFAATLWNAVGPKLLAFYKQYDGSFPVYTTEALPKEFLEGVMIKSSGKFAEGGPHPFVLLISFLCNFLEAKEVNELVTAYIHKFDAIQAFIDLLNAPGIKDKPKFAPNFGLFNDAQQRAAERIANQFRILQSVGKMNGELDSVRRKLYQHAVLTLGADDDSQYVSDEWLDANMLDPKSPQAKTSKPFRNFITNNVIKSKRFVYLTRYAKPSTVRAIMGNAKIVRYVLSRLPQNQIESYAKLFPDLKGSCDKKCDALTEMLTKFTFEKVAETREKVAENTKRPENNKIPEVQQLKALTGLYLAAAYVAVKNLVKANARYYIGYAAFDRDVLLIRKQFGDDRFESYCSTYQSPDADGTLVEKKNEYLAPVNVYLDRDRDLLFKPTEEEQNDIAKFRKALYKHMETHRLHFPKKWREIFELQLMELEELQVAPRLLADTRNSIMHLTVLANLEKYIGKFRSGPDSGPMRSYFELFHFVQQQFLAEKFDLSAYVRATVPSLDLIKLLYMPFAYSLPRYKNLTVDALFDPDGEDGKERLQRQKK